MVMAASFLVLVLLGTKLFSYSNSTTVAASDYRNGDYEAAYQEMAGLTIKEEDEDTYGKYRVMAIASSEFSSYQSFMDTGVYDMALDTLIRTVGRCDKYQEDAELYGCVSELENLKETASADLSAFGITEERAMELYRIGDRDEYTLELKEILVASGMESEEE
jgi:hypothetical protein